LKEVGSFAEANRLPQAVSLLPVGNRGVRVTVRATQRGEALMLELRPNRECCDCDLSADSAAARICSFECTFCADCATGVVGGCCPTCGGELLARPRRPARVGVATSLRR